MIGLVNRLLRRPQRRTDDLPVPFPDAWRQVLERELPFYAALPEDADRVQLQRDVYWFIEQKQWTPVGIEIDERMKVVIAAFACLLINRRIDFGVYPRTREVIVREGVFGDVTHAIAPDGSSHVIRQDRIGEAWYRGPVVLAWAAVQPLTRSRRHAHNVVIHEFAHALDYLDGAADGTPPLDDQRELERWARVFEHAFQTLRDRLADGRPGGLDPYAATNPAEFFAVVSEAFFCNPQGLLRTHPDLYAQLQGFFRHDPARWADGGRV